MNYNFEYNSPVMGKNQSFEYLYKTTNEYAFSYDRDIISDLDKYNAPIFVAKRNRGMFFVNGLFLHKEKEANYDYTGESILRSRKGMEIYSTIKDIVNIRKPMEIKDDGTLIRKEDNIIELIKIMFAKENGQKLNVFNIYSTRQSSGELIINNDNLLLKKFFILNIYNNYYLRQRTNNILSIFSFNSLNDKTNILNVYNNYLLKNKKDNVINIFDYALLKEDSGSVLVYDNFMLSVTDNNLYVYNNSMLSGIDNVLTIYNNSLLFDEINNDRVSVYNNYLLKDRTKEKMNIYEKIFMYRYDNELIYENQFFLKKPNNKLKILNNVLPIQRDDIILQVFNYNVYLKNVSREPNMYMFDNIFLSKPINELSKYKNGFLIYKSINNMQLKHNNVFLNTIREFTYYNDIPNVLHSNINKITINKNIPLNNNDKYISLNYNSVLIYRNLSNTRTPEEQYFIFKNKKYTHLDNSVFAQRHELKMSYISKNNISGIKTNKELTKDIYYFYMGIRSRKITLNDRDIQVYKDKFDIRIKKDTMAEKDRKYLVINETTKHSKKDRHSVSINTTDRDAKKDKHNIVINTTDKTFIKDKKDFYMNNHSDMAYKSKFGTYINTQNVIIESIPINCVVHDNTLGFVIPYKEFFIKEGFLLLKDSKNTARNDINEFATKEKYKTKYDDSIFAFTKEKETFLEYYHSTMMIIKFKTHIEKMTSSFASKKYYDTMTYKDTFITKESKCSYSGTYIFIKNNEKKTYLSHELSVDKNRIKSWYIKDLIIDKSAKNTYLVKNITIDKKKKNESLINTNAFVYKNIHDTFLYHDTFIKKDARKAFLYKDLFIDKEIHETFIHNDTLYIDKAIYTTIDKSLTGLITKKGKDTMYSSMLNNIDRNTRKTGLEYSNEYLSKDKSGNIEYSHNFISRTNSEAIKDNTLFTSKDKKHTDIDDYLFISKQEYEIHPYVQEIQYMQKIMKDLEKPVEKTYNWVYVYQYDDPIDPNYAYYGLDELLLPEKDVDYGNFEELIFNKTTMTPVNPIKELDDGSFIAKYPIKHPTPDYEKIGIEYIDVPSELMYSIFIRFYQIWYANIFKFGNMSMIDSLKLMLNYTYSYIVTTYSGTEYLKPALRVFRLIRWFGETSVMHNAQYKISYEYGDLKSDLHTGECQIKNELSNFYVNSDLKVLSSTQTGNGSETYIKLYTSNKVDTQMTFSVSIASGALEVYVNGFLQKTITSNSAMVVCEIPETDSENEIVLKRTNNYGYCYVGNIVIKNATFKNLNIEYDPELKAGNMPLSDIINKMVMLANMYEDENEAFERFREGNLGVSELYKKLEEYWELHHANKVKGKRLTIKET